MFLFINFSTHICDVRLRRLGWPTIVFFLYRNEMRNDDLIKYISIIQLCRLHDSLLRSPDWSLGRLHLSLSVFLFYINCASWWRSDVALGTTSDRMPDGPIPFREITSAPKISSGLKPGKRRRKSPSLV